MGLPFAAALVLGAVVAPPEEAGCPQWVPQPDVLARAELLSERFERAYGRAPVGVWAALKAGALAELREQLGVGRGGVSPGGTDQSRCDRSNRAADRETRSPARCGRHVPFPDF